MNSLTIACSTGAEDRDRSKEILARISNINIIQRNRLLSIYAEIKVHQLAPYVIYKIIAGAYRNSTAMTLVYISYPLQSALTDRGLVADLVE